MDKRSDLRYLCFQAARSATCVVPVRGAPRVSRTNAKSTRGAQSAATVSLVSKIQNCPVAICARYETAYESYNINPEASGKFDLRARQTAAKMMHHQK